MLGCSEPDRHEEQKIKGVVENKPLPVNSNDTKVVAGKMFTQDSNKNFYIILFGDQKLFIKEGSEFRLRIMISLQSSD